jgi:hypothetical protein
MPADLYKDDPFDVSLLMIAYPKLTLTSSVCFFLPTLRTTALLDAQGSNR